MNFYEAYGLNIQSDFILPSLVNGGNGKDLTIRKTEVKLPHLMNATSINRYNTEALFGADGNDFFLHWPGFAKILAKEGTLMLVEPEDEGMDPAVICMYILSEALGMILFQRGLFLLHASAVRYGNKAIAFCGSPGAGKSTTAASFVKAGYPVIADDMLAVRITPDGKGMVVPGFPEMKIWPSAAEGLEFNPAELSSINLKTEKMILKKDPGFTKEEIPLEQIFILEKNLPVKNTLLKGKDAFHELIRFFPLPADILTESSREKHFDQIKLLLNHTQIWNSTFNRNFNNLRRFMMWVKSEFLENA